MSANAATIHADERERIELEAARWLLALDCDEGDPRDDEAFLSWIEQGPAHGEIFCEMQAAMDGIDRLAGEYALPRGTRLSRFSAAVTHLQEPRFGLPLALAACLALVLSFVFWPGLRGPGPDMSASKQATAPQLAQRSYDTAIGEHRDVMLPDGSSILLGADSRVEVRFAQDARRVSLLSGEALFDVAHDSGRPFLVQAGMADIRVVGTKFSVERSSESVSVTVLEGEVKVSGVADAQPMTTTLTPGQVVEMLAADGSAQGTFTTRIQPLAESAAIDWTERRLSYQDVPLSRIVADINRYYAPGVRIADREAGNFHVTAGFSTEQIPAFLGSVGTLAPVEVRKEPDGGFVLVSRR